MILSQSDKKAVMQLVNKIRAIVNNVGKKINGLFLLLLKFVGFYVAFSVATDGAGGLYPTEGILTKTVVKLALALVCTILPARFGTLLVLCVCSYFMIQVSLFGGIVATLLILIIFLITVCITPEYSYLLLLVPFFGVKGWFMMVPVFVGIYGTPMAFVALIMGAVMWSAYTVIPQLLAYGATVLDGGSLGDLLEYLPSMIVKSGLEVATSILENRAIIFYGVLIAVLALITWIIGKLKVKYAPYWVIVVSGVLGIAGILVLRGTLGLPAGIGAVIFGTLCVMALAALIRFLDIPLDYRFVRNLSFSDDEFFYQVRLTPISKGYQDAASGLPGHEKKKKNAIAAQAQAKASEEPHITDDTRTELPPIEEKPECNDADATIVMETVTEEATAQKAKADTKKTKSSKSKSKKSSGKGWSSFWKSVKKRFQKTADNVTGVNKKAQSAPAEEKATQEEVSEVLKDF